MFGLFESENPGLGLVYFRHLGPPPAEAFGFVRDAGFEVAPAAHAPEDALWALSLRHPEHGSATAWLPRECPPIGRFLEFGLSLTQAEGEAAAGARWAVAVSVPAEKKHVLRDRKRLLRFMRALMAEDAVMTVDLAPGRPWSRASLDEELAHDADLDVECLYVYHAVYTKKDRPYWLHTHGLAELGGFDFDILRPNSYIIDNANEVFRALAFAMLEDRITDHTDRFALSTPGGDVRLIPARLFMAGAHKHDRELRDMGKGARDSHDKHRAIVCEPAGHRKLHGSDRPEPSRLLSERADDSLTINYTTAATELMAERARATLPIFVSLVGEFGDLAVTPLVKIGCPCASSDSREHIWFVVHSIDGDSADCTCVNEPWDVPSLREGLRGRQPLSDLTDWMVMCPAGNMTPRSLRGARVLRSMPAEAPPTRLQVGERRWVPTDYSTW